MLIQRQHHPSSNLDCDFDALYLRIRHRESLDTLEEVDILLSYQISHHINKIIQGCACIICHLHPWRWRISMRFKPKAITFMGGGGRGQCVHCCFDVILADYIVGQQKRSMPVSRLLT